MSDPRHNKILIVEDSAAMADALTASLRVDQIDSETVGSGEAALTAARTGRFGLVLLDLGLPDMDGLEVLERLKADPLSRKLPVMVVTGRGDITDKVKAFDLGAVDYINKPFNFQEVRARLAAVLRRKSLEDDAEQAMARERQRTHEELRRIGTAVDAAGDAIFLTDAAGQLIYVNEAYTRLSGLTLEQSREGNRHRRLFPTPGQWDEIWRACREAGDWRGETEIRAAKDQPATVLCRANAIRDQQQSFLGVVLLLSDITQRKRLENDLLYLANHDPLTGLHNRRYVSERLHQAIEDSRRGPHGFLLYLDLDHFKVINNSLDHQRGDQFLIQLAQLLREQLEPGDELARLGGDEFLILLPAADEAAAVQFAKILLQRLDTHRYHDNGKTFCCTASIGLARIDGTLTAEDVLAQADAACYQVKGRGRNGYELARPDNESSSRLAADAGWSIRIKDALREERLELWLQPIVPIRDETRVYYEVLLRLRDPDGQLVLPGEFIPAAENFGHMQQIDRFVLQRAVTLLRDHPQLALSINLSANSLNNPALPALIERLLRASEVRADRLLFEITETAVIQNLAQARQLIATIKEYGCRFALDDFGSGASSMLYLRDLAVDILKIDGGFIQHAATDSVNRALVESMNKVAHVLGKRTVAEFVTSASVLEVMREIGVDYVQGSHVCEAAPPEFFINPGAAGAWRAWE